MRSIVEGHSPLFQTSDSAQRKLIDVLLGRKRCFLAFVSSNFRIMSRAQRYHIDRMRMCIGSVTLNYPVYELSNMYTLSRHLCQVFSATVELLRYPASSECDGHVLYFAMTRSSTLFKIAKTYCSPVPVSSLAHSCRLFAAIAAVILRDMFTSFVSLAPLVRIA
eukprot:scaffold13527_cov202-Amphora_coffeaeformis.AAC.8